MDELVVTDVDGLLSVRLVKYSSSAVGAFRSVCGVVKVIGFAGATCSAVDIELTGPTTVPVLA